MEDPKLYATEENELFLNSDYVKDHRFIGLEISGQSLADKEFYNCTFERCNLGKMIFTSCRFENCNFIQSDISLIKLKNCDMIDVRFLETKMIGIDWTDVRTISMVEFKKSIMSHSSFYGKNLRSIKIEDCIAREADFESANLSKASCVYSDFLGSKFNETNLTFADFTNAKSYNIDPNLNKIKKAKFSMPEAITLLQCFDVIIE